MVNDSKKRDSRYWDKWKASGAIGNINGPDYGEAYAFFDCKAPITQIAQEIPTIRELVKTPRRLELLLDERVMPLIGNKVLKHVDSELAEIALEADDANIRYVLAARSPQNVTNRQTADELAAILNQAYQSPLYADGEKFRGEIAYKDRGRDVFRD